MVGLFCNQNYLLLDCRIVYLGGAVFSCYNEYWGGGTCGGFPWCVVEWFACVIGNLMSFTLLRNDEPFYYCVIWIYFA